MFPLDLIHTKPDKLKTQLFFSQLTFHPHYSSVFGDQKRNLLKTLSKVNTLENTRFVSVNSDNMQEQNCLKIPMSQQPCDLCYSHFPAAFQCAQWNILKTMIWMEHILSTVFKFFCLSMGVGLVKYCVTHIIPGSRAPRLDKQDPKGSVGKVCVFLLLPSLSLFPSIDREGRVETSTAQKCRWCLLSWIVKGRYQV